MCIRDRSYRDVLETVHVNKTDVPAESPVTRSLKSPAESPSDSSEGETVQSETVQSVVEIIGRPCREKRKPKHLDDYEVSAFLCCSYESECCQSTSDSDKWEGPKQDELAAMDRHNAWTLVPRDPKFNVIPTKWIVKEKDDGRLRARLVAVGCLERQYYDNVYSPVVNM